MVIDSMSRRARSVRRGLPATVRSPVSSLLMATVVATLLAAVGPVAMAGDTQLKLDERAVTAALATALSRTPAQPVMPTIIIDGYMPTIFIDE
jgi:hypothetical protein